MNPWRLIRQSLLFHSRTNLAVMLGVMAATTVLTGALLVGDSMQGSLRHLTLDGLRQVDHVLLSDRFFRQDLSHEIAAAPGFDDFFERAVPIVLMRATVENPESGRRASKVSAFGCDENFWSLDGTESAEDHTPSEQGIVINRALAEQLAVKVGDEILLKIATVTRIPPDTPLGQKHAPYDSRRLMIEEILENDGLARFSLRPSQHLPRNAFVRLETIQSMLEQPGKVNTLLTSGKSLTQAAPEQATTLLRESIAPTLDDYGLNIGRVTGTRDGKTAFDYFQLTSDQMVLPPAVGDAAFESWKSQGAQRILTYLANYITAGDGSGDDQAKIPYSMVTALDSNQTLGPLLDEAGKPLLLQDDEIVVNSWVAEDMLAQGVTLQPGDPITLEFFEPESTHGRAIETKLPFRLNSIAPLAKPGEPLLRTNDPDLTPVVPGVTDEESLADWDPPIPDYDSKRVRARAPNMQDEDYWDEYRTTPKAFVSFATGQRLWASRFGSLTSIRVAAKNTTQAELRAALLKSLAPESQGFVFQPIKRQSLAASSGTTPFGGLFLGFSFFIISAALMLIVLLFRLGIEQRTREIGVLLASGISRRRTTLFYLAEGAVVATVGSALGVVGGAGYAWLMLAGLRTWWLDAVVTPFLQLYISPTSLVIGGFSSALVSLLAIAVAIRFTRQLSIRQLLSGTTETSTISSQKRRTRRAMILAIVCLLLAVVMAAAAPQFAGEAQAGLFFGAGAMTLSGILLAIWYRLRHTRRHESQTTSRLSLLGLSLGTMSRNPARSVLTIGLVASASFLIVAIGAFRLAPSSQGSGGFDLLGESDRPLVYDLGSADGRDELGLPVGNSPELDRATVFGLRVQPGDDASCLNLYQPKSPRVVGVTKQLVEHYTRANVQNFQWAEHAGETPEQRANPWLLLGETFDNGAVPVVLDKNTAMYSMHLFTMKGVGTEFEITDDSGRQTKYRIVGLLANSIFQGTMLVGEGHFEKLFPNVSGYRMFLIQSAENLQSPLIDLLEDRLSDYGFDVDVSAERLSGMLAVQNTYLSTFQSLGALGLLLGTFGLATTQLRSVVERRGELALLRSTGFRRSRLGAMVMLEHTTLLIGGMLTGVVAAFVAVLPHWLVGGASLPEQSVTWLLAAVVITGLVSGFAAVNATLRAPLVGALRGE